MTGTLKKNFIKYVSLNILASMGTSAYILVDTYFIAAGVGAAGLTSLNLALVMFSIMIAIGLMLGIGGATRFAIDRARGDREAGSKTFSTAVKLGVVSGLIITVIGVFFSRQTAHILGANAESIDMTSVYLKTVMCFAPFYILNNIFVPFVRNDGKPRLAAIAVLMGNIVNIILDYVFIFPMGMGIFGAALATCTGPIVSMAILSIHFIKKENTFHFIFKSPLDSVKPIVALGGFSFVNEMASAVVTFVFNILLLGIGGNIAVASYGVIANTALVAVSTFTGVSQGSQPLVSHAFGSGHFDNAKKIYRWAVMTGIGIAALLVAVAVIFDVEIANIFNKEGNAQLTAIASEGIKIYFAGFIFASVNIITAGFMSAVEQGGKGFLISICRGLVAIIVCAVVLSWIFGRVGVWLAFPAAELITLVVSLISCYNMFRSEKLG